MEPEVLAFLKRIAKSLTIGLLWLSVTVTAALINDNAFIEGGIRLANVLFYVWMIGSVVVLVFVFKKLWTAPEENAGPPHPDQ